MRKDDTNKGEKMNEQDLKAALRERARDAERMLIDAGILHVNRNPEPGSYDCNLVDEASVERWSDTSPSYGEDGDLQG